MRNATGEQGADVVCEMSGIDHMFQIGLRVLQPEGVLAIYGVPKEYRYDLTLLNAPADCAIRMISPKEYLVYDRVCNLLYDRTIESTDHCTHVWEGLDQIHAALKVQNEGQALKSIIRIDER